MLRRLLPITLLAVALLATAALASTTTRKTKAKTVAVAAGSTKTISVPYPDALKYGDARYRGTVEVLGPTGSGRRPDLDKVKVLSKGSAMGGSEYQAKVRNGNDQGTQAVRVRVTAITVR